MITHNQSRSSFAALVSALFLLLGAVQVQAQSYSSYNTLFSGITVTSTDGKTFGFSMSSDQISINGTSYTLNDVSQFVLLYASAPTTAPVPNGTTDKIGNVGTPDTWTSFTKETDNNPKQGVYGWETTHGTSKDGQFSPSTNGFSTGNVFKFDSAPPTPTYYGFHVSYQDGNNITKTTGVSMSAVKPVPEPAFVQLGLLLGCAGAMALWKKRGLAKER